MFLRVWASTGFHPASPGPALAPTTHLITGLPAGSLRTLLTIRRDEPVAASLGRSTVRRRRRSCAVPFWNLMQSAGCRARPPPSGRPVRHVASSSVPAGRLEPRAGCQVADRHPEHGEAGRGQRLIAHTRRTPCRLPSVPKGTEGMPPRRGSFLLRWPVALLVRAPGRNRRQHQSLCRGSRSRPSCGGMRVMRPDNLARQASAL